MLNRKLFFVALLLLPVNAMADYNGDSFNDRELKTLFTAPAERRNIDASRQGITAAADALQSGPSNVHINGIVTRSNNKSVVWVNGQSTLDNTMVGGVKVYPNAMNKNTNKIPVMVDGRRIYVKPGETWSEETGISDLTE